MKALLPRRVCIILSLRPARCGQHPCVGFVPGGPNHLLSATHFHFGLLLSDGACSKIFGFAQGPSFSNHFSLWFLLVWEVRAAPFGFRAHPRWHILGPFYGPCPCMVLARPLNVVYAFLVGTVLRNALGEIGCSALDTVT